MFYLRMEKQYRLKKNEEIANVVRKKQKSYCDLFVMYYQFTESKFRVAISVSKKYGHAFERNKAKRIIREALKSVLSENLNLDLVIVVREALKDSSFEEVKAQILRCLSYIKKKNK